MHPRPALTDRRYYGRADGTLWFIRLEAGVGIVSGRAYEDRFERLRVVQEGGEHGKGECLPGLRVYRPGFQSLGTGLPQRPSFDRNPVPVGYGHAREYIPATGDDPEVHDLVANDPSTRVLNPHYNRLRQLLSWESCLPVAGYQSECQRAIEVRNGSLSAADGYHQREASEHRDPCP